MRVIAGEARSIPLVTVPGLDTRPTTDRIKETLFNMIHNDMPGCTFLDLFSGSGAIAIEAISRGAKRAVLVEQAKAAIDCIEKNLAKTRFTDRASILKMDVFAALSQLSGRGETFDFIFMDPPYNNELEKQVLERLAYSDLIDEHSVIIVEASLETDFDYVYELGFDIKKNKEYKTNKHVFLTKKVR